MSKSKKGDLKITGISSNNTCLPDAPLTRHAAIRMQQRNFSQIEINYVYQFGNITLERGAYICQLRFIDLPREDRGIRWIQKLVGTELILSGADAVVLTLYKNWKKARLSKKLTARTPVKDKFRQ